MSIYSAAVLLFLVMDPLGNIPFFLATLKNVEPARHKKIIVRELFIALIVLLFFLFTGQFILDLLQISKPSLSIAGGIILFLISIKMIFHEKALYEEVDGEPFIFPLAIPFVAGPSALATILFISSPEPNRWADWLIALLIAWIATSVILYFSATFHRLMGKKGLLAMERLMGLILTVVAVQMLISGLSFLLQAQPLITTPG